MSASRIIWELGKIEPNSQNIWFAGLSHNIIGGLGSAISEVLTEEYPTKLIRLGIKDVFGKSGKAEELIKYFGITADNIIEVMKK